MKRMAAIVVALLLLAGIGVWIRDDAGNTDHAAPNVIAHDVESGHDVERQAPPPSKPSPPASEPSDADHHGDDAEPALADRFEALDAAARSGDAHAACELAAELDRCDRAASRRRLQQDENLASQLASQSLGDEELQEQIDDIAAQTHLLDRIALHCAGIPTQTIRSASRYVELAAAAGHVPSQVRLLGGQQLLPAELLRDASPLATYRANATTWFRNALDAGDLGLLQLIAHASRWERVMPLADYLPEEWKDPAMVSALIDELSDTQRESAFLAGTLPSAHVTPTPAQRARAAELYARHFAASPPLPRIDLTPASRSVQMERQLDADTMRCDEGMP